MALLTCAQRQLCAAGSLQAAPVRCRSPVHSPVHTGTSYRTAGRVVPRRFQHPALAHTAALDTQLRTGITSQEVAQPSSEASSFQWTRCWYPVLPLEDLDASKPTPTTLLNKQLVLWQDAARRWCCFEDQCPHRLAPLSEGRIERSGDNVQLMCSYHGWQFDGSGRCTSIPQSEDPKAEATACASQRSCVNSYPTREAYGLLWVWPEAGPTAALEAAATSPVVSQRAHDVYAAGDSISWYCRSLLYSYDVLVENLSDPSHFPYSHHGLNPGIDRDKAKAVPLTAIHGAAPIPSGATTAAAEPAGADQSWQRQLAGMILPHASLPGIAPNGKGSSTFSFPSAMGPHSAVSFNAPSSIVHIGMAGKASFQTELLAVPTSPGCSKVFNGTVASMTPVTLAAVFKALFKPSTLMFTLFRYKQQRRPKWQAHLSLNKLFDQDGIFLAMQDAALSRKEESWAKRYYMPTSADACVIAAREWMDSCGDPYGGAGLKPREALPSMRQTLDRASQHTAHCRECQQAQSSLEQRLAAAKAGAVLAFAALCGVLAAWGPQGIVAGGAARLATLAAVAVLAGCGIVVRSVSELLPQFEYVPFHHHSNH